MPAETHVERDRSTAAGVRADPRPPGRHPGDRAGSDHRGASFGDDLGADSLALIELVEALEEELGERTVGFRIDDEDLEDLKTVRDAVDYVVAKLDALSLCRLGARDDPSAARAGPPDVSGTDGATAREALAGRLGWDVADAELLTQSLAHRSWCAETPGRRPTSAWSSSATPCSGLVVTDHLFRTYPDLPEGELAKVRASVVNSAALAEVAAELDVGDALLLGKGEGQSGGREKPSILADAMEALIGAVYLDRGWEAAAELVMRLLGERIEEAAAGPGRPGLQDPAAGAVRPPLRPAAGLRGERRGPRPRQAVRRRWCMSAAGRGARARAGRRSRPSRPRPGWRGSSWPATCRSARGRRPMELGRRRTPPAGQAGDGA